MYKVTIFNLDYQFLNTRTMDIIFELFGLLFVFLGILGSFLPVLPGPLTGWVGLFLLHQSDRVQDTP